MSKNIEAIFIGGCVIDFLSYAERFPAPGETLIGSDFKIGFGGKAANSCVMAARMGLRTAMIAKVGTDVFGRTYADNLKKEGINTDNVTQTETETTTTSANIVVAKNGENSIVHVHGSSAFLTGEIVAKAEGNLFPSVKLVVLTYEGTKSALLEGLRLAKKYKATTYVNAAPINPEMPDNFYSDVDIFSVNATEVEAVSGQKVECIEDAQKATRILQAKGCSTVIITLGERGTVLATKQHPEIIHIPINTVTVKDTTGAGDAFNGAFAYNFVRHPQLGLEEQIRRACSIATITVQYPGTQSSFPRRENIPEQLL